MRPNSLNTISLALNGRMVGSTYTYGLPAMITNSSMHLNTGVLNKKKQLLSAAAASKESTL